MTDDQRLPPLSIDDDVDEVLGTETRREEHSKGSLIREALRERYGGLPPEETGGDWTKVVDEDPEEIEEVAFDE